MRPAQMWVFLFYSLFAPLTPIYVIDDNANNMRIPSASNLIGVIDILDDVQIEFDIVIHSFSSSTPPLANILHFGDDQTENYPSIHVDTDRQIFQIEFNGISDPSQHWQSATPLTLGQTYHFQFDITHQFVQLTLDSSSIVYNSSIASHSILSNKNMYIGSPWNSPLNATIYALTVYTGNSDPAYNYLCDYAKRFSVLTGTWTYDSNSCELTQQDTTLVSALVWMYDLDTTSGDWTDYTLSMEFNIVDSGANYNWSFPDASLIYRTVSRGVTYVMLAEIGNWTCSDGAVAWLEYHSWTDFVNAYADCDWDCYREFNNLLSMNTRSTLKVVVSGNNFAVSVDDIYLFSVTDSTFDRGSVGLGTYLSKTIFYSLNIVFPDTGQLHTISPSNVPTKSPTLSPTFSPSVSPANTPSYPPTYAPTIRTIAPTLPTTNAPTMIPTITPSNTPSYSPTYAPTATTNAPTLPTTNAPTLPPTKSPPNTSSNEIDGEALDDADDIKGTESHETQNKTTNILIHVVVGTVAFCFICGLFVVCFFCIKKRKKKCMKSNESNIMETDGVSTQTQMTSDGEIHVNVLHADLYNIDTKGNDDKGLHGECIEMESVKDLDVENYLRWTFDEFVDWIISLEGGKYAKYEKKLRSIFKNEHVNGSIIAEIDKTDWRVWGIVDFKDRLDLHKNVQNLIRNNKGIEATRYF